MGAAITLDDVRKVLDIVVGPDDLVAKVPELQFDKSDTLLKQNGLSALPPLPSKIQCQKAKEQDKALIFRVAKDGKGQAINLKLLKERFGKLIYSTWYLKVSAPFADESPSTGWALVDLDPLPGSTDKTFEEQEALAKEQGSQLKSAVADTYDLLVAHRATGKYFRGEPINARTKTQFDNESVKISHFDKSGMCISTGWGKTVKHADIGAATELVI